MMKTKFQLKWLVEPEQERFPWARGTAVFQLGNRWLGCLTQWNGIVKEVCGHLHRSERRAIECAARRFPEADYGAY
jgi:hypothetical protein